MEEAALTATLLAQHRVPIIDVAHITKDLVCPVKSCTRQAAQKLHRSFMEKGFALLVNHGITEHKLQSAYCKLDMFCSLPEEQRVKFGQKNEKLRTNHYKPPGRKVLGNLHEYKHVFCIKDIHEEALPEKEVPGFTTTISSLIDDFKSLASVILQFIAIACDLEPKYFIEHHSNLVSDEDESYFQMTYFPPMDDCKPVNERSSVETKDSGTFSIISQDSEVGLEVLDGSKWIPIGYLPGSLLIRAGHSLQKWTDGLYKPTVFRMVVPDDSNVLSRSRHCILLEVYPNNTTQVEPISLVKNDFNSYFQTSQKKHCSLMRAFIYIRRRIRQLCR